MSRRGWTLTIGALLSTILIAVLILVMATPLSLRFRYLNNEGYPAGLQGDQPYYNISTYGGGWQYLPCLEDSRYTGTGNCHMADSLVSVVYGNVGGSRERTMALIVEDMIQRHPPGEVDAVRLIFGDPDYGGSVAYAFKDYAFAKDFIHRTDPPDAVIDGVYLYVRHPQDDYEPGN